MRITELTIDPEIQLQARGLRDATVAAYIEALSGGSEFPPIVIFDDGKTKWVSDGFHRLEAHRFLGLVEIEADVHLGTHKDAMVHAAVANVTNGEPMSQSQKREAGERLLRMTDWSDYEIARKLAVGQASVWRWRQSLSNSNELDSQDTRTVTRGGTTYTMDVSNIGQSDAPIYEDRTAFYERWARDNAELGLDRFGDPIPKPPPHVCFNTGENEWYTPPEIIEAARVVMGTIDLDPASTEQANTVIQATKFYTLEDDGLSQEWRGKVWMNPPYAAELIGLFASKLATHVQSKDVTEAIILVNNATETGWFSVLVSVANAICFPQGRVKFWAPDRKTATPLQGQAIIYVGENTNIFIQEFKTFGWIARIISIDN